MSGKIKHYIHYIKLYSDMAALIQSKNHAANKGKTAGRYQFDTHPTGIGLITLRHCTFIQVSILT